MEGPVVEEPAVEEPAVEEPAVEEPAARAGQQQPMAPLAWAETGWKKQLTL